MNTIIIIPARKGSKGIPGKNKKELAGKPLIQYTIEVALQIFPPEKIYLSTDDPDIIKIGVQNGLNQTNLRPSALSTDTTSARELLLYEISKLDMDVETIVYLQPTSPLRQTHHVIEAMDLYDSKETEMVVSVYSTKSNPYYNLFEENKEGFLSL
ncbi:acylneuraminate cytidylyltransferase family protein, partial [Crocinitomicaceae bacterium]|nr:acylneuraminate cytidylyltransferase family protein [Crocinitomicaceae bacterium]